MDGSGRSFRKSPGQSLVDLRRWTPPDPSTGTENRKVGGSIPPVATTSPTGTSSPAAPCRSPATTCGSTRREAARSRPGPTTATRRLATIRGQRAPGVTSCSAALNSRTDHSPVTPVLGLAGCIKTATATWLPEDRSGSSRERQSNVAEPCHGAQRGGQVNRKPDTAIDGTTHPAQDPLG